MNPEKLQYGKFYHIYSHGVGMRNVFSEAENYEFFLHLYDKYVEPIGKTYAWVLMPNHVHFAVQIKNEEEIAAFISDRVQNSVRDKVQNSVRDKVQNSVRDKVQNSVRDKVQNSVRDKVQNSVRDKNDKPLKIGTPSQQFAKLFNSYAQSYNKWVGRWGYKNILF